MYIRVKIFYSYKEIMEESTKNPSEEIDGIIREFKECESRIFSIFGNNIEKIDVSLM